MPAPERDDALYVAHGLYRPAPRQLVLAGRSQVTDAGELRVEDIFLIVETRIASQCLVALGQRLDVAALLEEKPGAARLNAGDEMFIAALARQSLRGLQNGQRLGKAILE